MITFSNEITLTTKHIDDFITAHKAEIRELEPLGKAYESDYPILHREKKEAYKPDNRIVANFAKYIVDTMNGFFIGNPIKTLCDDEKIQTFVDEFEQYNNQDDKNAEISKISSTFGYGYEMYYADERANLCSMFLKPTQAFMVFDESIIRRPLYFVRYYTDYEGKGYGSVSDRDSVRYFSTDGKVSWIDDWEPHFFDGVPATEFVENQERQGLFEPVMSIINAYNKTISEKANDVEYFADAYLKVLGAKIEEGDLSFIRDNRVVNFGDTNDGLTVEFMDKPQGDQTQENLLDRMERLIFQLAMVANISDENFGNTSGVAMKYKLQAMNNLEKTKERKFTAGMNNRYKLLFSHPTAKVNPDGWVKLKYHYTPNTPANLLEESQIATALEGVVSKETQLRILSIIDDVKDELAQIKEEEETVEGDENLYKKMAVLRQQAIDEG